MMCRKTKGISFLLILSFMLFLSQSLLLSANPRAGNIVGTVYEIDGTTPVQGAVIKIKHVSSESKYQSAQSDDQGAFSIKGIKEGIYAFGISTPQGDFNSSELIGVEANKTSTLTLTVEPFDEQTAEFAPDLYQELVEKGESVVGYVIEYDITTEYALIFLTKGFVQLNDRVRILGEKTDEGDKTDFKMNVKYLERDDESVKKVFAGETILMKMEHECIPGDLVIVVCKKGIIPFFIIPVGLITGTGLITDGDTNGDDDLTPFGKKK
jgi:hypothetical protein